jgi:hypothetical protein
MYMDNPNYIPPEAIIAGTWCRIREKRAKLLADSDWTQTRDCPLEDTKISEWATYRQTLRDMPSTQTITLDENNIPNEIVWPTPPT